MCMIINIYVYIYVYICVYGGGDDAVLANATCWTLHLPRGHVPSVSHAGSGSSDSELRKGLQMHASLYIYMKYVGTYIYVCPGMI